MTTESYNNNMRVFRERKVREEKNKKDWEIAEDETTINGKKNRKNEVKTKKEVGKTGTARKRRREEIEKVKVCEREE